MFQWLSALKERSKFHSINLAKEALKTVVAAQKRIRVLIRFCCIR
jgi:hypothetical protein